MRCAPTVLHVLPTHWLLPNYWPSTDRMLHGPTTTQPASTASSAPWYFAAPGADTATRKLKGVARGRVCEAVEPVAKLRNDAARRAVHRTREATAFTVLGSLRRCSTAGSKTCKAGPWRRVSARELEGCKGSRARHVEMRERPHRHKTSSAHSLIAS